MIPIGSSDLYKHNPSSIFAHKPNAAFRNLSLWSSSTTFSAVSGLFFLPKSPSFGSKTRFICSKSTSMVLPTPAQLLASSAVEEYSTRTQFLMLPDICFHADAVVRMLPNKGQPDLNHIGMCIFDLDQPP